MKIFVCGTKNSPRINFVDGKLREYYIAGETDNCEDSIGKEDIYSELTGLYYIWKHINEDIVGLEQYRKFFITPDSINYGNKFEIHLLFEKQILDILNKYEIIVQDHW